MSTMTTSAVALAALALFVAGCGEPGNRPYCAVCSATGLCVYTPEEVQADAEKKAALWGTPRTDSPRNATTALPPMPMMTSVSSIPPMRPMP